MLNMSSELIVIEKKDAMAVFTNRELITPLLLKIEEAAKIDEDVTTEKGRKAIASMAYKVAQSKSYIEGHGKELAAELKEIPKLVDSNRKYAKDFLDDLRDRVRKPLDDWEAAKAAEELKAKIEEDHEMALLIHRDWTEKAAAEAERIAQERIELERKMREAAELAAKEKAEADAKAAIIAAETRALDAERAALKAQELAKLEIERERLKALEDAQRKVSEEKRLIAERDAAEERIKQNKEHRRSIHCTARDSLVSFGIQEDVATALVIAIAKDEISCLRVVY